MNGVVRSITIQDGLASPELVTCELTFAGEWAEGLGIKTSGAIAADAVLPQAALPGPGVFLASLQQDVPGECERNGAAVGRRHGAAGGRRI